MSRSNEDGAKAVIENVLHTQQEAWNRHDLEGFMAGYWNSPQLTFFSGAKEHDGWQATVERYRAAYASPGHEMGKLNSPACALKCWARMRPSCAVRGC
jgi:beta-aspartyl-peptidase (threonine type)